MGGNVRRTESDDGNGREVTEVMQHDIEVIHITELGLPKYNTGKTKGKKPIECS